VAVFAAGVLLLAGCGTEATTTTTAISTTTSTILPAEASRQLEIVFLTDFTSDMLLFVSTISSDEFDDVLQISRGVVMLEGIEGRVSALEAPTIRTEQLRTEMLGSVRMFRKGWAAALDNDPVEALRIFEEMQAAVAPAGERVGSMWGDLVNATGYEMTSEQRVLYATLTKR